MFVFHLSLLFSATTLLMMVLRLIVAAIFLLVFWFWLVGLFVLHSLSLLIILMHQNSVFLGAPQFLIFYYLPIYLPTYLPTNNPLALLVLRSEKFKHNYNIC
jgi:hypothetical protein